MIIFLVLIIAIAFYVFSLYNRFVTLKTRIKASIQEIGNQLKRQANLIPNLVDSVKGYMKHEKSIFQELTEARKVTLDATAKNDPQKMIEASSQMERVFGRFQALMESTPELKAVEAVTKLMDELRDTADKLMYSRRTLIDLSADYNVAVVTFPSNLVARLFNFVQEKGLDVPVEGEHLTVTEGETKTPSVNL